MRFSSNWLFHRFFGFLDRLFFKHLFGYFLLDLFFDILFGRFNCGHLFRNLLNRFFCLFIFQCFFGGSGINGIKFCLLGLVAKIDCLEMRKGAVDFFFQGIVGNEGHLCMSFNLKAFARVDVHAFSVAHSDEFKRAKAFHLDKFISEQGFFNHLEKGACKRLASFLVKGFIGSSHELSQFLKRNFVLYRHPLLYFIFQHTARLEGKREFGRHKFALLGNRADHHALQLLFHLKTSEAGHVQAVFIVEIFRQSLGKCVRHCLNFFLGNAHAAGNCVEKIFVVHIYNIVSVLNRGIKVEFIGSRDFSRIE